MRAAGQCAIASVDDARVHEHYQEHKWAEVVAAAQSMTSRSADADFEFGMALAHMQRWDEARSALMAERRRCPGQKRFAIELAGVEFQQKRYPEAARWIEKGLRLDAHDEYANDFAGTVFLLMGNLDAALKYWNRIQKPQIDSLNLDSQLHVQRLLLERAFVFSPQAEMRRADYE
jgi:predicted Zn-dependent protease